MWKVLYRKYLIGSIQMLWISLCRNNLHKCMKVQYSASHFFSQKLGCFPPYLKSKLFRLCFEHGNDNFSKNTNCKSLLHCYKILLFRSFYSSKNFKKQCIQHFHINQQKQHIKMISEGSCDTEDCSNDAEISALITGINYILKYIKIGNWYFK